MFARIATFFLLLRSAAGCSDADLVVYGLTFETFWTREAFPKQYPEYRPPAHWSKLIGMTHDGRYTLFRIGQVADKGMKIFAETGKTDHITTGNQTFDEFQSPPIRTGAGRSEVNFFADGNHTMVSLAAKIVPSPDWFVGVDSLVLCTDGHWVDSVTVRANPIDAGTDSGFTFTSPNWETDPPEKITQITSTFPGHPANSFYYPSLDDLPTIATFRLKKKKFYRLVKIRDGLENKSETTSTTTTQAPTTAHEQTDNEVDKNVHYQKPYWTFKKTRFHGVKCKMGDWSQWSSCNATCGNGHMTRTRKNLHPLRLRKKCPMQREVKKCTAYFGCYDRKFTW